MWHLVGRAIGHSAGGQQGPVAIDQGFIGVRPADLRFLRELRADPALSMTSVVVLTTSNADRDKVDAYKLNVSGYLLKPVTFVNFVDLMVALNKFWTLVELP